MYPNTKTFSTHLGGCTCTRCTPCLRHCVAAGCARSLESSRRRFMPVMSYRSPRQAPRSAAVARGSRQRRPERCVEHRIYELLFDIRRSILSVSLFVRCYIFHCLQLCAAFSGSCVFMSRIPNQSINQSINQNTISYSAICRERITGLCNGRD